jgi:hypothetical protein
MSIFQEAAHMDGIWHARNGRCQSQYVMSTHEYQIYIVQQNQIPIHRKTAERTAAVENLNKQLAGLSDNPEASFRALQGTTS